MILPLLLTALATAPQADTPVDGVWQAWLDSPGGALHFDLQFDDRGSRATLINGVERIAVPELDFGQTTSGTLVILRLPHYDAELLSRLSADGRRLDGVWRKRAGAQQWRTLLFHATWRAPLPSATPPTTDPGPPSLADSVAGHPALHLLSGRWRVHFSDSKDPAVGIFTITSDGQASGTFLTTLGDYRYLVGTYADQTLTLSTFDGAHAFLFRATLDAHESEAVRLVGDFWSGDSWHETWSAVRDDSASLSDGFAEVSWTGPAGAAQAKQDLATLTLPDLDGEPQRLDQFALRGKVAVISLFGTWCPNCNDEAALWAELHERYAARGLAITGLAFELTGDPERDAAQVRRFRERHGATWPMLLAGTADKEQAARAFPLLSAVKSYPTAIFIDHTGAVRAVHSGFAGPATGAAHEKLREDYERLVVQMLEAAETAESADR